MNTVRTRKRTIDKAKLYSTLYALCWITVFSCWILKLFGYNEFSMPEYTNNIDPWIKRIVNYILYNVNSITFLFLILKRKPKLKEVLLTIALSILPFSCGLFIPLNPFQMPVELIIYFLIGIICLKDKWYKVLLETLTISFTILVYQIITMLYKNINVKIILDNFIVTKILLIDYYVMLIITVLHNVKKGGYIYDRWSKLLVLLSKRIFSKRSLPKNSQVVQQEKLINDRDDIANELGYKIYIVILSLFQITTVGVVCYFVNQVIVEYFIIIISFFFIRKVLGNSYHVNSVILCTTLAMLIFTSMTRLSPPQHISILLNILLGGVVAYMMYVMYYYVKYTNAQGITICKGMFKEDLLTVCKVYNFTELETNILLDFYCKRKSLYQISLKYNYSIENIKKIKANTLKKIDA